MDLGLRMHAERTPNPNSIKWILGRPIVEAAASVCFESQPTHEVSPLAHRLFQVEGVQANRVIRAPSGGDSYGAVYCSRQDWTVVIIHVLAN